MDNDIGNLFFCNIINIKKQKIDDNGVLFLGNLLRYYEKLCFFNISHNKFQAKGLNELKKALKYSKRFSSENAIIQNKKGK